MSAPGPSRYSQALIPQRAARRVVDDVAPGHTRHPQALIPQRAARRVIG
jgi:hypothetical protein